jgi:serine/threonine protein kinase
MGLRYCHSYGIVHMDIKPANILVSKTLMAKITDFGEAINFYDKGNVKSGKTYPYAAPEMTQGK